MPSLQREQLEPQAAALATSGAPLAWRGARPRRADSGPAWANNGQGPRRPPLRQLSFSRAGPGLLNWGVERAEARERERRRQPRERSGQGRARRAGRQNGTQTRAARAATLSGTDSPFTPLSWLLGGKRGRVAGRRTGETGEWRAPGCLGPAAPNFGGTKARNKLHRRLAKPLGRAHRHLGRRTPPPGTRLYQPGVYTVKACVVLRPPPPPPNRR